MTIAFWCILIMILFPYLFTVLAKSGKKYDNHNPRQYLEKCTGWRHRANCVQMNSFEILPGFGLAVIVSQLTHAPQHTIDVIAISFVISRIIYGVCYLIDKSTLRTIVWFIGICLIVSLFVIGAN